MAAVAGPIFFLSPQHVSTAAILVSMVNLVSLMPVSRNSKMVDKKEYWWEFMLSHPARILLSSFSALCAAGTLLPDRPVSPHRNR